MSAIVMTKRWERPDGTYLEIDVSSNGGIDIDITDPFGGSYNEGRSQIFSLDAAAVNELRELLS